MMSAIRLHGAKPAAPPGSLLRYPAIIERPPAMMPGEIIPCDAARRFRVSRYRDTFRQRLRCLGLPERARRVGWPWLGLACWRLDAAPVKDSADCRSREAGDLCGDLGTADAGGGQRHHGFNQFGWMRHDRESANDRPICESPSCYAQGWNRGNRQNSHVEFCLDRGPRNGPERPAAGPPLGSTRPQITHGWRRLRARHDVFGGSHGNDQNSPAGGLCTLHKPACSGDTHLASKARHTLLLRRYFYAA